MEQSVINDIVLKKIQGSPFTSTENSVAFEKPGSSAYRIQSKFIYSQDIPDTAPSLDNEVEDASGTKFTGTGSYTYIAKYDKVWLKPVAFNSDTFYYGDTQSNDVINTNKLIDAIPSNQDPAGSYQIVIFEKNSGGIFEPTSSTYFFDTASGYITFAPNHGYNGTNNIAYITYFRYEGDKGVGGGKWTSSNTDIYYNDGNVGIGTSSPYAKFHVVGESGLVSSTQRSVFTYNSTGLTTEIGAWGNFSIYANNAIGTSHYFVAHSGTISA